MRNSHRRIALLTGASSIALSRAATARPATGSIADTIASVNALSAPLSAPADTNFVWLEVAYDAFAPADSIERHELEWRKDATLNDYLQGLPAEAEWMVFVNGVEVDPATEGDQPLQQLDRIGLVLVPQGLGSGGKAILRTALMIAGTVMAFIPGMQWWAAAAIMVGIGLVNTFLLTPKPPKSPDNDTSNSYGIDGAKNSATEGIPYPIVYGEFRVAGNFSDVYTENVGDDQYLYLRTVLNDGEIEGVYDIELNEQPIANFKMVETRIGLGTLTQTVNSWFPSSIVQMNKGVKLDTTFTNHTTSDVVDRVRFDVTFPGGLVDIDKDDGSYGDRTVEFEIMYRQKGVGTYVGMPIGTWSGISAYETTVDPVSGSSYTQATAIGDAQSMSVTVDAPMQTAAKAPIQVDAINTVDGTVHTLGYLRATEDDTRGYVFDEKNDGSIAGNTDITPMVSDTFEISDLPPGNYKIRTSGTAAYVSNLQVKRDGDEPQILEPQQQAAPLSAGTTPIPSGTGRISVTDNRTRAIRKSFVSSQIPTGFYDVQIRRVTPADPSHDDWIDEVYLTDVAEIQNDPVAMRGTANLSLRIKLNDQLNQIPQMTARIKGSKVRQYDIEGNQTAFVWSNNVADVALDILLGIERGAGFPKSRIDWPRWMEWRQYCIDNNLTFNGVFDTNTTLGDALIQVMRIGHAAPVPFGTKISVAVDNKRDPVHVFTNANILKDSFSISYMSMADRANEYEFTFFDKTDRNKSKTLRYVDPKAVVFNEAPRTAQVTLAGVDNFDQARKELWRAIYQNRLLIRTIQFDAWLDAINMAIGEVALIQHDMMEWANSGRLQDGCTTMQLKLDQHVDAVGTGNAIVHFDALKRVSSTIAAVVGRKIMIVKPGGANFTTQQLASKRLIANGRDFEIAAIQNGTSYHTVTLAEDAIGLAGGQAVELWDTDCIEEREVLSVQPNADGTTSLNLKTPLPQAPTQYANFAYGPLLTVTKPYTLIGVSGNGLEKRRLTFVEYNEGVYGPPEVEIPIPVTNISSRMVRQVSGLMMDYDSFIDPVRNTVGCRISWSSGGITNYGGADVYLSLNGGPLQALGSAVNITELHTTLNVGDSAIFKVVAYNQRGDRAPFASAPMIGGTIDPTIMGLPMPTNFTATQTSFTTAGSIKFDWLPPLDTTAITGYEISYKRVDTEQWTGLAPVTAGPVEITGQPLGDYTARIRSVGINGGFSDYVIISYEVTHPDINAAPVGLQLNGSEPADQPYGEFQGRDAIFTWTDAVRDEVYFLDYQVTIFDDQMVPLRTEYTVTPNYTYTFDKNTVDGAGTPRRAFNFEVRQRGRQGQISAARTMFCQNPAPAFMTAPTVEGALNSIIVNVSLPPDPDLVSVNVYATLTDPCTTTLDHLVYSGLASQITIQPLANGAQHYIIVVPVDAFGPGAPSAQYVVLPTSIDDYFDEEPPEKVVGLVLTSDLIFNTDGSTTPVLTANWSASIAPDINQYEIQIRQDGGNWVAFAAPTNTYQWAPVVSGSTYQAQVRGVDHTGNKGLWSDIATHTVALDHIPPAVPTNLTAAAAFTTVFLEWTNPDDFDLAGIAIYESTTNDPATATKVGTVNALPGTTGTYTRLSAASGTTYYYWISAIDTSGNESGKTTPAASVTTQGLNLDDMLGQIDETQIAPDSITSPMIKSNAVISRTIQAGSILTEHMIAGTILGDRIKAGTLEGASLNISTSLPASITIGATGVSIGTVQTNAATGAAAAQNFNANNDRNGTTPTAPTILADGTAVDHSINTDGTADISFEWQYTSSDTSTAANNIDGFIVYVYSSSSNAAYTMGSNPSAEHSYVVPADKRAMIFPGLASDQYYTFGVQAYRMVDSDIDPSGQKRSAIIQPTAAGETRYQPSANVAFNGNVTGTIAGTAATTVVSNAATGAADPAGRINANSTLIAPGKIQLTGATTLSSILWGSDMTQIDGGKIAANTISANKISIGVRGIDIAGIEFEHNKPSTNTASWTAGTISYTDDTGANVSKAITAGSTAAWTSGTIYIYWVQGATALSVTTALDTARGANNVILATYRGGTDLVATYGRTIIDGSDIKTQTITADRLNVASLSAITATIGTFQSAPSGQRVVISDALVSVYDSSNVLRVRLGIW